ncbi:MAG: GcrA cell cycle regulator [Parcubacteria group bacterium]|nr:GcrA cell cycle regulator [Parcubacteria group bacterium]
MGWDDERVALLKKLWLDGLSASQVAKKLGGTSRNAVIGKVHRLGLSGRETASKPRRVQAAPAPRPARRLVAVASPPLPKKAVVHEAPDSFRSLYCESPGSATVLTLGAHMCKWPIGDPCADSFTFCGRKLDLDEGPYCGQHAQVAFQPQQSGGKVRVKALENALRPYI